MPEKLFSKKVITELKTIYTEKGVLKAEDVVSAAEPESSPLHKYFEWDDSEAAKKYRIEQARDLIRVTVEYIEGSNTPVPVFVNLRQDRMSGGGYRTLNDVMGSVRMRRQLLADALYDLQIFELKYKHLNELAKVFTEAKRVRQKFERKKKK